MIFAITYTMDTWSSNLYRHVVVEGHVPDACLEVLHSGPRPAEDQEKILDIQYNATHVLTC